MTMQGVFAILVTISLVPCSLSIDSAKTVTGTVFRHEQRKIDKPLGSSQNGPSFFQKASPDDPTANANGAAQIPGQDPLNIKKWPGNFQYLDDLKKNPDKVHAPMDDDWNPQGTPGTDKVQGSENGTPVQRVPGQSGEGSQDSPMQQMPGDSDSSAANSPADPSSKMMPQGDADYINKMITYTILMKARYEMPGGDFLGMIFAFSVLGLALAGATIVHPNSRFGVPLVIAAWAWSTCAWVSMVKAAQESLMTTSLYPTTSFWTAFFPQMLTAFVFVLTYAVLAVWKGTYVLKAQETGIGNSTWFWGGAASMFEQLFMVMAFGAAVPGLVFVARTSQTLLGSMLGLPGLGKGPSWYLLGCIAATGAAIAATSYAAVPEASWMLVEPFLAARTDQIVGRVGLVFTLCCAFLAKPWFNCARMCC